MAGKILATAKRPSPTPNTTKRLIQCILLGSLTATLAIVHAQSPQGNVNLAPSAPLLTAVDPYANPDTPNQLNPSRPYWYSANATGLTILKLADNTVLGTIAWPATYELAMPDGTMLKGGALAPVAGWQPVGLLVPYPSLEAIGIEAVEGSPMVAFVEMKYSGYEWRSSNGRFRDTIAPATSTVTDSSLLLTIDVTDPATPVIVAGALLSPDAGQMAWEPSAGAVYVGGAPSASLPAGLQSFISKITPPEVGAEPPPPFAPETLYPLCGPEIEWSGEDKSAEGKTGVPVNVPGAWICDTIQGAGEGEGPFIYQFTGLPAWLTAHVAGTDPGTQLPIYDGLLFGTPTAVGKYTFVVTTTDTAAIPPQTASAVVTIDVMPTVAEYVGGEWEGGEAGVLGALAIEGTGPDGSRCALTPTASGLPVPGWIQSVEVPNGCVILGMPTLAGEYYEFQMPNFHFPSPYGEGTEYDPVVWKGAVLGTYGFDALPDGTSIKGLAYHEIDMIPGEPDKYVLNGEFIGIDTTGQLWNDVLPYEFSDTIEEVGPPATIVDGNELSVVMAADGVTPLRLTGSGFGNIVVEADGDIFVAADGAVIKFAGGAATTIPIAGAQPFYLALDSDLAPAVKQDLGGLGQHDRGFLWVTNPGSGNVTVINTANGVVSQTLGISGATGLGSVAVDSASNGLVYVAVPSSGNVTVFGSGTGPFQTVPKIALINWAPFAVVDPTLLTVGEPGSVMVIGTGWPMPGLAVVGALPLGMAWVDNLDGTMTISGTPSVAGVYTLNATATNAVGSATQTFTLTVNALDGPAITSVPEATLTLNVAGQFKVEATGMPTPILTVSGALPAGVTFHDNAACSPAIPAGCTGSAFLGGIPTVSGTYPLTITATNSQGTATQAFTLSVNGDTAPLIVSADTAAFKLRSAGSFTVMTTGSPAPTLSKTGALPDGVTFNDNHNGTATLAGAPTVDGSYPLTITAANGVGSNAIQKFYLTISHAAATTELLTTPAISSPSEALAVDGQNGDVFAMTSAVIDRPTGTLSSPAVTHLDNTGNFIATIAVEQDAEYMAVNSRTHRLYVPQWDRSRLINPAGTDNQGLAIIDTVNNTVVTTIDMPVVPGSTSKFYPVGVAVDEANNVIYVGATTEAAEMGEEAGGDAAELPGYILAFDGSNNSYLGAVTAGRDPESLVFNPTSKRVYAANEDDGTVTSVAGMTRSRGKLVGLWSDHTPTTIGPVFETPCDTGDEVRLFGEADKMVVNPVTNKVYVTDDAFRVAEIDAGNGNAIKLLELAASCGRPVLANNLAIAPSRGAKVDNVRQGILYVTSEGNTIIIVDLSTFTVAGEMTIEGAHNIDWPVINPQNRLFITDETWPIVFVYALKDGLTP